MVIAPAMGVEQRFTLTSRSGWRLRAGWCVFRLPRHGRLAADSFKRSPGRAWTPTSSPGRSRMLRPRSTNSTATPSGARAAHPLVGHSLGVARSWPDPQSRGASPVPSPLALAVATGATTPPLAPRGVVALVCGGAGDAADLWLLPRPTTPAQVGDLPHGVMAQWRRWCPGPRLRWARAVPCCVRSAVRALRRRCCR